MIQNKHKRSMLLKVLFSGILILAAVLFSVPEGKFKVICWGVLAFFAMLGWQSFVDKEIRRSTNE